jgi:hypothetical protein
MKQTAVDWLLNEIDMQYPEINVRRKEWMVDKAKEMEKEQIEESFTEGCFTESWVLKSAEQYYEENYGKK